MENNQNTNPANGERTFTQDEVNRIIGERLAKEKAKGDAASAEREQQLAEREKQLANREALYDLKDRLKDMGLPAELLPVLNVQDKGALDKALEALNAYIAEKSKSDKEYKVWEPLKLPKGEPYDLRPSTEQQLRSAMGLPR